MRVLFGFFILLLIGFFFLQGRTIQRVAEKPVFLRIDEIANDHQTHIDIAVHASIQLNDLALEGLKKDYSNLWGHLNHLYETNDIIAGKEYYTEAWYKQIAHHYAHPIDEPGIKRMDLKHALQIQNWSSDGLVCTAFDRNVILKHIYPGGRERISSVDLAVVLLYQGDHWRLDGLSVLDEKPQ